MNCMVGPSYIKIFSPDRQKEGSFSMNQASFLSRLDCMLLAHTRINPPRKIRLVDQCVVKCVYLLRLKFNLFASGGEKIELCGDWPVFGPVSLVQADHPTHDQ